MVMALDVQLTVVGSTPVRYAARYNDPGQVAHTRV